LHFRIAPKTLMIDPPKLVVTSEQQVAVVHLTIPREPSPPLATP